MAGLQQTALGQRNFLIYWLGSNFALLGLWIYRVSIGWLAWELTQSEFWVGVISFLMFFPAAICGPVFGVLADRWNLQQSMVAIQAMLSVSALALAGLVINGWIGIGSLCVFALLQGGFSGAYMPMRMAMLPHIVAREFMPSGIAFSALAFNVSRFVGPAIAGFMIAMVGTGWSIGIYGVCLLPFILAVTQLKVRTDGGERQDSAGFVDQLFEGFRYAAGDPVTRNLFTLITVSAVLARGPIELLPAISDVMLGSGSSGFAMLTSATGAGAIIAAIFLARHSRPERLAKIAVWACVVNALLLLILGYTRDLHLAVAIVGLAGAAATLCGIAVQTLLQLTVDDDKRGRVMGLWGVFAMGGSALGGLVLGAVADAVSLSVTIRWDAVLCLVLTLVAGRRLALKSGAGRRMSHAISRNRTVVTESR